MSFFKEEFDKFMNECGDSMTEEEKDRLNEIRNAGKLIVDFMLQYVKGVKSTKGLFELENDINQKMQEKYSQRECVIGSLKGKVKEAINFQIEVLDGLGYED